MTSTSEVARKRPRRPLGRDRRMPAHVELAIAMARSEAMHRLAEPFTTWEPGTLGRPTHFPQAVLDLFGVLSAEMGSDRRAEALLASPITWEPIRQVYAERYPEFVGLRPGGRGPSRSQFWRNYNGAAGDELRLRLLLAAFSREAAEQSIAMGMFDPTRPNLANPDPLDFVQGDGTVLASRFRNGAGVRQVDVETGEITEKRYDPDAAWYTTGDKQRVVGTKFGLVHNRLHHPGEWVVLSIFYVPSGKGNGEAESAIEAITELAELLPGLAGVIWDMALRGVHIDQLYALGLLSVVKVAKAPDDKPKELLLGPVPTTAGDDVIIRAVGGAAHVQVALNGQQELIRLEEPKLLCRRNASGSHRWYGEFRVPDDQRIARRLRGQTIRLRLDTTDDDRKRNLNRAENLRPIAEGDDRFATLHPGRPVTEALNAWFKRLWRNGRAPAVGKSRQHLRLFFAACAANVKASMAYEARTGSPPGRPLPQSLAA